MLEAFLLAHLVQPIGWNQSTVTLGGCSATPLRKACDMSQTTTFVRTAARKALTAS